MEIDENLVRTYTIFDSSNKPIAFHLKGFSHIEVHLNDEIITISKEEFFAKIKDLFNK